MTISQNSFIKFLVLSFSDVLLDVEALELSQISLQ